MHRYVMTGSVKTRLERSYERTLRCRGCGEEIAVGNPVVRSSSKIRPPPLYHERCYEAMLH